MSQESDALAFLADFLATKPSMDDIAQHLALEMGAECLPRSVLISLFDTAGTVHTSGSFGIPTSLNGDFATTTLWDVSPASEAIREGHPIIVATVDEFIQRYPDLRDHAHLLAPAVVWPIQNGQQRVGAVHMQCGRLPEVEILDWELSGLGAILGMYLRVTDDQPEVSHANPELTPRQQEVLDHMSQGATNVQIARRMGFSESTIKQETMAIYRHFGVHSRAEAIRASQDH